MSQEILHNGKLLYFHFGTLFAGLGMISVSLIFFAYIKKRQFDFRPFWWGCAAWLLTTTGKLAAAGLAVPPIIHLLSGNSHLIFARVLEWIFIGLLTGVFECVPIFLVLKRYFQRNDEKEYLAFGYGFGTLEALVVGGFVVIYSLLVFFPAALSPSQIQEFSDRNAPSFISVILPGIERCFTIFIHVTSVLLIARVFTNGQARWFWLSFLLKTFIDSISAAARSFDLTIERNAILVELIFVVVGGACLFINPYLVRKIRIEKTTT